MAPTSFKLALAAAAASALAGCTPPPKPIVLDEVALTRRVSYAQLAKVLKVVVDADGFVDPDLLAMEVQTTRLNAQLYRMSVIGPTATRDLFLTPEDRLAYWYNARAAWSLKLALLGGLPASLQRRDLCDRKFPVDGRRMTLGEIDALLSDSGGWLAMAAAPGVLLSRAAPPQRPFSARDIRERIERRFNDFIDDEARFIVDVRRRRVVVPSVLWRLRENLIRRHEETGGATGATLITSLLPLTTGSAHRRVQDAVGYRCVGGTEGRLALLGRD